MLAIHDNQINQNIIRHILSQQMDTINLCIAFMH